MVRRTRESRGEVYYPPEFRRLAVESRLARERLPSRIAMWCAMHSGWALNVLAAVLLGVAWYAVIAAATTYPWATGLFSVSACLAALWALRRATK